MTCTAPEKRYMDVAIEGLRGFTICLPDAEKKALYVDLASPKKVR